MTDAVLAGPEDSDQRKFHATFWTLFAFGTLFTILNLKWPIARNALCYAKASLGLIQNHFNLLSVARNREWTAGKPIFFTVVAAPFVRLFGANPGMIVASFLGTAFFLGMSALALPRLNKLSGVEPRLVPLELVLVMLNPLSIYQFWSAYPDSLFAALILLSFFLIDIIAREPGRDTRWHIVGLGLTILIAIHTKLYGAALLAMCSVYLLVHVRHFFLGARYLRTKLALMATFAALILGILLAAKSGSYPLLDLSEGAGFDSYLNGLAHSRTAFGISSIKMLVFAIVLAFHCLLPFLFTKTARSRWARAPTLFIFVYLLGLLPFPGTGYNMRYFLPAFVFLAPSLAAGVASVPLAMRRVFLGAYGVVAVLLILAFNLAAAQRVVAPSIATAAKYFRLNLWLDNLRLPIHMVMREQIDSLNRQVRPGSVLYWSSHYYGTTTHGLAEDLGVKAGLEIRYVLDDSEIPAQANPFFLIEFTAEAPPDAPTATPARTSVSSLGQGLFRLDPIPN